MSFMLLVILMGTCLVRLTIFKKNFLSPYIEAGIYALIGSLNYQITYGQLNFDLLKNQLRSIFLLAVIFYCVYLFIYSISSKYLVQFYFTIIITICVIANKLKIVSRGEIILWSDFKTGLVKDVVWNMVLQKYIWLFLAVIIAIVVISYIIITRLPHSMTVQARLINFTVSTVFLYAFLTVPATTLNKAGVVIYPNNNEENLKKNGPGLMFFISKEGTIMSEPENYNKKIMNAISKKISTTYKNKTIVEENPTFIYILSEAFYDPTAFEGTQWKEDPMPVIRSLQEESGGYMLANVFGGGTANTEYSVLSNFSHNLLNVGSLPYSYIYENPTRNSSEISFFNQLGYKTSAIHPYWGDSYKRKEVFESFGFERFKTIDDMKNLVFSEGWTSDSAFFKEIYQELTPGPQFIHGISMQNHFDYTIERKGKLKEQDNLLLNKEDIPSGEQLAMYARGIKKTDDALSLFLNRLKSEDKEVYVVFYGDHLPALDNKLYASVQLTTNKDQEIAKYMTPYFIWNNKGKKVNTQNIVNPEFLTLPALVESGIDIPAFYLFMYDLSKELSAFDEKNKVYILDGKKQKELSEETKELVKNYKLIMYDMLSGNEYTKNIFK